MPAKTETTAKFNELPIINIKYKLRRLIPIIILFCTLEDVIAVTLDMNHPLCFESASLAGSSPSVYLDANQHNIFVVFPQSYRPVFGPIGPAVSIKKLSTGRVLVRARFAPFPIRAETHVRYASLISSLKKYNNDARIVYPELRDPRIEFLGHTSEWLDGKPTIAGVQGDALRSLDVTFIIKPEYAARFLEDVKRPLGVVGKFEFIVSAISGRQLVDWPVGFAWYFGVIQP